MAVDAPNIQTSKNSSASRLAEQIKRADKMLQQPRKRMREFVQRYAGAHYAKGLAKAEPLQMLYSLVSVLTPNLAIYPECMVTTEALDLIPFSDVFRTNINKCLDEIRFARTMERVIVDSFFMMGITKTGLCDRFSKNYDDGNSLADPGKVFVDRVPFDNWIGDLKYHDQQEMPFEGDRYLVDYERALELYRDHERVIKSLGGMNVAPEANRTENISADQTRLDEYLTPQVQLCDVYLRREGVVVTVAGNPEAANVYLNEREYKGPELGPYDYFQLSQPPDNFLQVPVISIVYDLHILMNSIARKIQRQAERQKSIVLAAESKPEDAGAIKKASDGDVVLVSDPTMAKEVSFGGVENANYQVVAWLRDYFNVISGNPELLGGLGPQANTLGQDQMNHSAASVRVSWWRQTLLDQAGEVIRKVAWYEWTDPIRSRDLTLTTDTGVQLPVRWEPSLREGEFIDYNFSIDPYTKRGRDPDEQYQRLTQWLNTIVFPMQQIGALQGQLLQPDEIVRVSAKLLGIREAGRMFRRGAPLQMQGGANLSDSKPRSEYADNRVVRRLPAKPQPVESQAEQMGVET